MHLGPPASVVVVIESATGYLLYRDAWDVEILIRSGVIDFLSVVVALRSENSHDLDLDLGPYYRDHFDGEE